MPETQYDPDAGGVGYLTWTEYERFTRAVDNAITHTRWWRLAGHIRTGDPDEHRTRSNDPTIPLPATWLAAEEISNLLQEINHWPTLEDVAKFGHELALMLTREVETAMHKWPMEDRPHKVRHLKCRTCGEPALRYYPPKAAGTDITVKCTSCKAVEDPQMFEHDILLIRLEAERAKTLADRRRSGRDHRQVIGHDLPMGA